MRSGVKLNKKTNDRHLHQCRCGLEAHDGDRLPLASPRQPVEGGAGAGEGAEGGGARGGRGLGGAHAVHLLHHAEGATPGQGVYDLHTHTRVLIRLTASVILTC